MEVLLLVANGSILSLLYQKLLDNAVILADLRNRVADLEALAAERRKRGKEGLTALLRDDTI